MDMSSSITACWWPGWNSPFAWH